MGTSLRWPAVFKERRLGSTPLMSRRRLSAPPGLSRRQDQALSGTMRLVRELGPTAFVLQEEEQRAAEHRVFLGNPHSCSCSIFVKEKDLCKHICWLLLKKFKLPRDHEYALQLGLVEREINQVLQGLQVAPQLKLSANSTKELQTADDGYIKQKQIDDEDVCPICQDKLLKRMLPVTYCRCTECSEYHLCHGCFRRFCHPSHSFAFREKRNQRWRSVEPVTQLSTSENLQSFNPENSKEEKHRDNCIPEGIINSLPTVLVGKCSSLLDPGLQCRLCLKIFHLGQMTRFLPCNHKFHRKCIDHWLHKENACPIDGHIVYNPLTWENVRSKGEVTPIMSQAKNKFTKQDEQELFIPGTGLLVKQMKPGHVLEKSQSQIQVRCKKKNNSECEESLTQNGFNCTCTRSSASSQHSTQKIRNLKFSRYARGLSLIPKPHADVFTQEAIGTALRGLSVTRNAF
ncbi:E3 ubiquitin-protein ligase ZSWIM2 isoform X3 [Podarcis muralis]